MVFFGRSKKVFLPIGAAAPEGSFDCDNNEFIVNGGTLVGIGGNISRPSSYSSTQNIVILGSIARGNTMSLIADDGTVAFAFTVPQAFETMVLSSPRIITGTSYSLYTGGVAAAESSFGGMFLGDIIYSGGTFVTRFNVSSGITKLGGTIF